MTDYPLPKFHFRVEWGGTNIGFTEVTGLSIETEVIQWRTGADLDSLTRKMPGMKKFGDVTLKRGVFENDNEFYDWWNTVNLNTVERRDITISLLNEEHDPVMIWKLRNAWPIKITPTGLNATENAAAIEEMVVATDRIEQDLP
jgi:phage tail-like protein